MQCDEFRRNFNQLRNDKASVSLPVQLQEHLRYCKTCQEYTTFLYAIEEEFSKLEPEIPSEELLTTLRAIGNESVSPVKVFYTKKEILRFVLRLPLIVSMLLTVLLGGNAAVLAQFVLVTAATASMIINSLKPYYFQNTCPPNLTT